MPSNGITNVKKENTTKHKKEMNICRYNKRLQLNSLNL